MGLKSKGLPFRQGDKGNACHGQHKTHKEGGPWPGSPVAQPQQQGGSQEGQLGPEAAGELGSGGAQEKDGPGQHKPEDEDLHRMEGLQKDLGGDIGGAPHHGHGQGQQMAQSGRTAHSGHTPFV